MGAGFAGTSLTWALRQHSLRIALIDRQAKYPEAFRAEKLETDQVAMLNQLDLLDARRPATPPLRHVDCYRDGVHYRNDVNEQYGIHYTDTVNNLRQLAKSHSELIISKISALYTSPTTQTVELTDGRRLTSRLIIMCTGGNIANPLLAALGVTRAPKPHMRSLSFAFDIERRDGAPFGFTSFTYFLDPRRHGIDLITLFPLGTTIRVNLFTQWLPRDPRVSALRQQPLKELETYFPDLFPIIGDSRLSNDQPVEAFPTGYYRLEGTNKPGIVVVGDEFQSVSPATGLGLSKVLTDVIVLGELVPQWLATPGMDIAKTQHYYRHPRKRAMDNKAHDEWACIADNARYPVMAGKIKRKLQRILRGTIARQ